MAKTNLKALGAGEVREFLKGLGLPAYRASQLLHWIYQKKAASIGEVTEFSKGLRDTLQELAYISSLKLAERKTSSDGTEKFLFELEDGKKIESVLIPDGDRLTLCISSQAGCAMGCGFCLTGRQGFERNLQAHEIVDQVIAAGRLAAPERITNIVFMGMGEPLKNLVNVAEAVGRMTSLMGISGRRITVSTSGLAREALEIPRLMPHVNLAVSLNATTDEVRDMIMPVNRRCPIKVLMDALKKYPLPRRSRITFEYVMIAGLNDTDGDARRLVSLIGRIPAKVNLIPLNEHAGCIGLKRPTDERIYAFQKILTDSGLTALIRKSKGQDILAACGQLRGAA